MYHQRFVEILSIEFLTNHMLQIMNKLNNWRGEGWRGLGRVEYGGWVPLLAQGKFSE